MDDDVKSIRSLAEDGNAIAQKRLGDLLCKGDGLAQDFEEAVKWYRSAAEQGNPTAYGPLGELYAKGQGVPKDIIQAYMWLSFAEWNGNFAISERLDALIKHMTPSQIAKANKQANNWKPKR